MQRYFEYQLANLPTRPLRGNFAGKARPSVSPGFTTETKIRHFWIFQTSFTRKATTGSRTSLTFPIKERVTAEPIKLNEGEGLKDLALATQGVNNGQAIKTGLCGRWFRAQLLAKPEVSCQ